MAERDPPPSTPPAPHSVYKVPTPLISARITPELLINNGIDVICKSSQILGISLMGTVLR